MSIKNDLQQAMKEAMKSRNSERLDCLRMAKGALLMAEKAGPKDKELSDEDAVKAIRSEVRKRQESVDTFRQHGKEEDAARAEREIAVLDEFLPKQLNEEQLVAKVQAYLAEHPDIDHPGKLTGALKKELGDSADGKMLNEVCRKVLEK
jgi:uncharacterized protein